MARVLPALKNDAADLASLGVCSLIWGTTWFAITLQLGTVPPVVSILYRFVLAAVFLFGWLALMKQPVRLTRAQHLPVLAQGLFTFATQYSFVYLAEERVTSAAVAVMFAGLAYLNLVVFRLVLGQRAARGMWIGAALGALGVGVMSAAELMRTDMSPRAIDGLLLALAAVLVAAGGNLFAHRAQREGAPVGAATAWAMLYGSAGLAAAVLVTGTPLKIELTAEYLGSLAYLALLGSVVTFVVYFQLARRRGYAFASYIGALTPVIAVIMSVLFEGARFGWAAVAGLALVLAGQVLLSRAPR